MELDNAIFLLAIVAHSVNQSCLVFDSVELAREPAIGLVIEVFVDVLDVTWDFIG